MKLILHIVALSFHILQVICGKYCQDLDPDSKNAIDSGKPLCSTNVEYLTENVCIVDEKWSGEAKDLLPPWMNTTLVVKGQQFAMDHFVRVTSSFVVGNMLIIATPPVRDTLLFTGNSNTPQTAGRRYAATIVQVSLWLRRSLTKELDFNWVLSSLAKIREIHNDVALRVQKAIQNGSFYSQVENNAQSTAIDTEMWAAFERDVKNSNIPSEHRIYKDKLCLEGSQPMNQLNLATTQWAFIGPALVYLENVRDEGNEGVMAYAHLWAVIGYALGLEDKYNLGLQNNITKLREVNENFYRRYLLPNLFNLDYSSKVIMESYEKGMRKIVPLLEVEALQRSLLGDVVKIDRENLNKRRSVFGMLSEWLFSANGALSQADAIFPAVDHILSPLAALYHFLVGLWNFPFVYTSDENIAKSAYYYKM